MPPRSRCGRGPASPAPSTACCWLNRCSPARWHGCVRCSIREPPADAPVAAWRAEIDTLEQKLQFRRQLYNQAAHKYNDAVRQFPTRLLMPLFRFAPAGTL